MKSLLDVTPSRRVEVQSESENGARSRFIDPVVAPSVGVDLN